MDECEARCEIDGWLEETVLSSGRCSSLLRAQLAFHLCHRIYNVYSIMDEIRALEGTKGARQSVTKPADEFHGPLLKGLWHKHHFQTRFLPHNLGRHWKSKGNDPALQILLDHCNETGDVGHLAYQLAVGGYEARARCQCVTGEWIVYARLDGRNCYLTLGEHGQDMLIRERALSCCGEFPQLAALLNS